MRRQRPGGAGRCRLCDPMTRRFRDCGSCGRPVGKPGRELCARCHWRVAHAPAKDNRCPRCGENRVLRPETGRCARCSRTCRQCDAVVLFKDRDLCKDCHRRQRRDVDRLECPRCGKRRLLRATTGWCGSCSHPGTAPNPEGDCIDCGRLTRLTDDGRCRSCWGRSPERISTRAVNLAASLQDPPVWLAGFAAYLAGRHHPSRACGMLTRLGNHLRDDCSVHPQKLLDMVAEDAPLSRALQDYYTSNQLALPTDRAEVHAAARRACRVAAVPEPLRGPAAGFVEHLLAGRGRARRAGTRPRGHATLEARLTAVRDLAIFLVNDRGKGDWATVEVTDIEAFLAARAPRRAWYLTGLRQFFGYCVRQRLILIDPTTGVRAPQSMAFHGKTLPADRQRDLFLRWTTDPEVHPHEAFVGLAALLHAATTSELQHLTVTDVDHPARKIHLGHRRHPTPLDPFTWQALQACLTHRQQVGTANAHVLITTRTQAIRDAASEGYVKNTLRAVGIRPRILRSTRLIDMVASVDVKLVADAYGMTNEAVITYLADHVDSTRLPNP